ncbi:hypothetical protein [Streptomyces sp. TRM75561]|nr:hypothetical protein [Streptomyces sp. TRM75561]MDH3038743.1 hypothetical protein [Streptomyces sp. TRM75561]
MTGTALPGNGRYGAMGGANAVARSQEQPLPAARRDADTSSA